jgi:NAD(P)-dependent dehydrogenase (short-subunit alcohol dehydrogenase family)
MAGRLEGKRVLILGAETEIGRAVVSATAEAGASVAAIAATSDADAAFAVQRLARGLSSGARKVIAQAIDGTNEAAVRMMVRQVSKELGGLDAIAFTISASAGMERLAESLGPILQFGGKELDRKGGGSIVVIDRPGDAAVLEILPFGPPDPKWRLITLSYEEGRPLDSFLEELVRTIAGEPESG